MAKRKELAERNHHRFFADLAQAMANTPLPTLHETWILSILDATMGSSDESYFAKILCDAPRERVFAEAFILGYKWGYLDAEAGHKIEAASGSKDAAGKLKGAFPLFVYELARLGVPLKAESIEKFWGAFEDACGRKAESHTPLQRILFGLFKEANERANRPLVPEEAKLDETGAEPVIRYRLEGENKRRTCTHHNLKTRVIPAVQKALSHK